MAAKLSYNANQRAQTERLRKLLVDLPELCYDFVLDLEPRTSILTRINYCYDLRVFLDYLTRQTPAFQGRKPADLTAEDFSLVTTRDLNMYLEYLNLYEAERATRTNENLGKKRKLSALRTFYRFLHKDGYLKENVTELIDMPKVHQKPIVRLERTEVAQLLDSVESGDKLTGRQVQYHRLTQTRDLALMTLMLGTGIRISECVGLDIPDVDLAHNSFRVLRKGGDTAVLYFDDEVHEALAAYLEQRKRANALPGHEQALFLSIQNRRMTARAAQNLVKKYASGVTPLKKITPHKFRSTFGTALYQETGDIYLVADVLGHKDVNVTRRHYAAMSEENRRLAAQSVRLRPERKQPPTPPPPQKP